ncbi:hypothetical protein [Thalassovita aquimarina]|uniref:hypothetical protein n=1 Tax=Thalassovita aquimarina TaxID=2785917 RepID=UPI00356813F9
MQSIVNMVTKGPLTRTGNPSPIPLDQKRIALYVGVIAFALPCLLYASSFIGDFCRMSSISHYYYIPFWGSFFVGCMGFIAVFLFCYRGHTKWDNYFSTGGAVGALCIAVFPTLGPGCVKAYSGRAFVAYAPQPDNPLTITTQASYDYVVIRVFGQPFNSQFFHFLGAFVLFSILAYFALYAFRRDNGQGVVTSARGETEMSLAKKIRNTTYLFCGLTILACMAAIGVTKGAPFGTSAILPPVFTFEAIALFAFGLSWMVKGRFLPVVTEKQGLLEAV